MFALFWVKSDRIYPRADLPRATQEVTTWLIVSGVVLSLGAVTAAHIRPVTYLDSFMFVGVVLFCLGVIVAPRRERLSLWKIMFIGVAIALYVITFFQGGGRLNPSVLLGSIAVLACTRFPGRLAKVVVVVGTPVVTVILTAIRTTYHEAQFGPAGTGTGNPDSTVNPLETLARLLDPDANFAAGNGSTLWATFTIFVPRGLWPDKPIGFGAVLTRIFEPQLVAVDHSMAALAAGEWFFNWGWAGLVAMVLGVGWTVRWIDRTVGRLVAKEVDTRLLAIQLAMSAIIIAGLADFVWVGTFTYASRAGLRVSILLIIIVFLAARAPRKSLRSMTVARNSPTTPSSRLRPGSRSTSPTRTTPGSAPPSWPSA